MSEANRRTGGINIPLPPIPQNFDGRSRSLSRIQRLLVPAFVQSQGMPNLTSKGSRPRNPSEAGLLPFERPQQPEVTVAELSLLRLAEGERRDQLLAGRVGLEVFDPVDGGVALLPLDHHP